MNFFTMSETCTDSELPQDVTGNLSKIPRRAFFFNLLVVSVFAVFNLASSQIFNFIASSLDAWLQSYLLNAAVTGLFLGTLLVQLPIFWMLVQRQVASRGLRWVAGLAICHMVVLLISIGSRLGDYADWGLRVSIVEGCLTAYLFYVFQGACLQFWGMICGLKTAWSGGKQTSRFSLMELFTLVFVISIVSVELAMLSAPSDGLAVATIAVLVIQLGIFGLVSSLLVTLGIGSFVGRARVTYATWFFVLVAMLSLLFVIWQGNSGADLPIVSLHLLLLLGTYVFGSILTFLLTRAVLCRK